VPLRALFPTLILATLTVVAAACPRQEARRPAGASSPASQPALASAPAEFGEQARWIWRLAACALGWQRAADDRGRRVFEEHCRPLETEMLAYRRLLRGSHRPFLARVRPRRLPGSVVYPFAGGDLLSALTVFPDAAEITTISLEHGGDPRVLPGLSLERIEEQLSLLRTALQKTFRVAHSTTRTLDELEASALPGPLALALSALVVHEQEPVSLRYFQIDAEGRLRYLSVAEVGVVERLRAPPLRDGRRPGFSPAFSHFELRFRPLGGHGPVRTHRHLAADLEDSHLRRWPGLLQHLQSKGRVAAMTKASSYLLWREHFSVLRGYLLSRADWIICDSSGPPVREALAAGFVVEKFGGYRGAFLPGVPPILDQQLQAFWRSGGTSAPLSFRFGYPDRERRAHLLIMRRAGLVVP